MTMPEAVKALSKGKVSGTAPKKKVAGTKKRKHVAGPAKVAATKRKASPRKVTVTKTVTRTKSKAISGVVSKAMGYEKQINRLEAERKKATTRDLRDLIQLRINKLHKDIRACKRSI